MDLARNRNLHGIRRLRIEVLHDPGMPCILQVCARGISTRKRAPRSRRCGELDASDVKTEANQEILDG